MTKQRENIDPRILRTRQLLRDALIALTKERDFKSLTVKDITDKATLNKATFYLHYTDLDDLLIQSTVEMQAELVEAIRAKPVTQENLNADLLQHLTMVFQHFALHRDFYDVVLNKIGTPPVIAAIRNPVEAVGQQTFSELHGTDPLVDHDIIVRFTGSGIIGLMQKWLADDAHRSPEYMAEQCRNLLFYGVYYSLRHSKSEKDTQVHD